MKVFTVLADPMNEPSYVTGVFKTKQAAEEHVIKHFGTRTHEEISILPGSYSNTVKQYVVFQTVVSICEDNLQ